MANTNCLEGMRCPKCKSEGPFTISVTCLMTVYDNGTEDQTDTEWEDDSFCSCSDCGHAALVKDFKIAVQEVRQVRREKIQHLPLLLGHLESKEGIATLEGRLKHAGK